MKKFIIMAVSLLLTALLALAGCMYAIGENKAESKPYDMGETVSVAPEDTPTAQEEMEKKFSVYNHVTEENGKKILTLFSEEQAEEQWTKRENGEEFRLTYDEILFLINDSQRLYETYDEIILTNASEYGVAATEHEELIVTDHLQRTGLTYSGERDTYYQRETALAELIRYRLFMLDSGLRSVKLTYDPNLPKHVSLNGESVPASQATVTLDDVTKTLTVPVSVEQAFLDLFYSVNSVRPPAELTLWALLPENTSDTGEAYREALVNHLFCAASGYAEALEGFGVTSSVLVFRGGRVRLTDQRTGECIRTELSPFSMPFSDSLETFFVEVEEWLPDWELKASYLAPYTGNRYTSSAPSISLCSEGRLFARESLSWENLQNQLDPEGIVDAIEQGEAVGILTAGELFLKLDLSNGTSILFPLLDTLDGETLGAAAVVESAAEYGEVTLYRCVPAEFLNSLRMQFMIASNDWFEHGGLHYFVKLPEDYPCVD